MYVYICKHIHKCTHIHIDYLHKNTHICIYLRHSRRTQLRPPSHNAVDLCISCSCTNRKYASAYFVIGKGSYFGMFFHVKNIHHNAVDLCISCLCTTKEICLSILCKRKGVIS